MPVPIQATVQVYLMINLALSLRPDGVIGARVHEFDRALFPEDIFLILWFVNWYVYGML